VLVASLFLAVGLTSLALKNAAEATDRARKQATGCEDGTVELWDAMRRQPLGRPLSGQSVDITSVAFSPDSIVLFTYDVAENARHTVIGKCAHLFIIRNGRFSSHDYITYYSGQG
jgi:WD40 repeat protein